ncbi:MAG TPA: aminotransferase class V-fold PLP-dependent enzyme, partial [Lacipirellulaceae bacterium]|nr:aminotransferase class V-fold PLP-dependent enzyme [Lacipirellulaceae bacterium]
MPSIYLDHNAAAPILPAAADAVREAALRYGANPESQHEPGRDARRALEALRSRTLELLGAGPGDRLVFTSGGTEANNLALTGLTPPGAAVHLVISPLEHASIARTADYYAPHRWQVGRVAVGADGVGAPAALADALRPETRLASVMLASHETGVLQRVAELAALCRARGVLMHTDAAQVVGKLPVSFRALGVDALSLAAHKFHGPLGIGGLLVRAGVELRPALLGGFQQAAARPGTESVALAAGLVAALEAFHAEAEARRTRLAALRDELERLVLSADGGAVVVGAAAPRVPHTSCLALPGLDRQALVMALDLAGVACSTGSACASGSSEPS